jgi:hypothetical protein
VKILPRSRREFSDKDGDRATAVLADLEKAVPENDKDDITLLEKTVQRFQQPIRLDCRSVAFVMFSTCLLNVEV